MRPTGIAAPGDDPGPQPGSARTEEEALEGVIRFTLAGEPVTLRTLSWEESDEWLGLVAQETAGTDVSEGDATADFRVFLTQSSAAALRLVTAYDRDGLLGGETGIKARGATKREIRSALEVMVAAEDPFGEDAVRSVVAAFGEPSRTLWRTVAMVIAESGFLRALSIVGHIGRSASATRHSGEDGPESSSSSDGPTPITRTRRTKPRQPSGSSAPSPTATPASPSRTTGASARPRSRAASRGGAAATTLPASGPTSRDSGSPRAGRARTGR